MTLNTYECKHCDSPLPVSAGETTTQCRGCKTKYFWLQETPPAVGLDLKIDRRRATRILAASLGKKEISQEFRQNAKTEGISLFYIPLFEVRRTEIAWTSASRTKPKTLTYHTQTSLELGNDLSDLEIGTFDIDIINRSLLSSRIIPFKPAALKRKGMILSFNELKLLNKYQSSLHPDIIENMYRIIYFPLWEIRQSFQGIIYKSYVSATNGEIIKVAAPKNNKKRIQLSFLGLFSLAILLSRGTLEIPILTLLSLIIGLPITILLTPYFWDLFTSQEILEIKGSLTKTTPLYSSDDSFVSTAKKWFENLKETTRRNNKPKSGER